MTGTNLSDTQPRHLGPASAPPDTPNPKKNSSGSRIPWRWVILALACFVTAALIGASAGWQSARRIRQERQAGQLSVTLDQQYELAVKDMEAGRYDIAIQRFQYILEQDPGYPGATDKIAEAMQILFVTATPTPPPPTPTPTPTADPRPVQELYESSVQLVASQDWNKAIESLAALRKADRAFMTVQVDGMLFISLRSRGLRKILNERNLQGGTYDLALAERFGPIDAEANNARNLARWYLYGVSFWEVDWAKAVEYFSQVASASPNLTDSSGMTASERYRIALINYGDQLANMEDWCNAQAQYELALSIQPDSAVEEKLQQVTLLCQGPSPSPSTTGETETPTVTATGLAASPTASLTQPALPSATSTQGQITATSIQPSATTQPTQPLPSATSPAATPYPGPPPNNPASTGHGAASERAVLPFYLAGFLAFAWHLVFSGKKK